MQPAQFPTAIRNLVKAPTIHVRFLSDTVVIAASVSPRKRAPRKKHEEAAVSETGLDLEGRTAAVDAFMRYVVCQCVCAAMQAAALSSKPIAYRGVVAVGYFAIDDNILLGPAVDEAAGLMEVADASVVWLTPGAGKLKHVLRPAEMDLWTEMVISTQVPLKDGRAVRMRVINPFALATKDEAATMRRNLLRSMASDRLEVVVKQQNTVAFFKALDERARVAALKSKWAKAREAGQPKVPEERRSPDSARGAA
jgi:hypothetical protein